jgi:hypothetical protein
VKVRSDHHPITGVHELLRLKPKVLKRLVQPLPEAPDFLRASTGLCGKDRREQPLDLGVKGLNGSVEIAPVVRLDALPHDLHVLRRHRPRSISLRGRAL